MTNNIQANMIADATAKAGGDLLGSIVWADVSDIRAGFVRKDLRDGLIKLGLKEAHLPAKLSPPGALWRARADLHKSFNGWRVDKMKSSNRRLYVWKRDGKELDAVESAAAYVQVVSDGGYSIRVNPAHECAEVRNIVGSIVNRYEHHMKFVSHRDVSRMIVLALTRELNAIPLKKNGHLYWVPEQFATGLSAFKDWVATLGGCGVWNIPIYDTPESREAGAINMSAALTDELNVLRTKFTAVKDADTTRASTLEKRLADVAELRTRFDVVKTILGQHAATVEQMISITEKEFGDAFDAKQNEPATPDTRPLDHRSDGTQAIEPEPKPEPKAERMVIVTNDSAHVIEVAPEDEPW